MLQAYCTVPVCAWCSGDNNEVVLLQLSIRAADRRSHQLPQLLVEECHVHKHPVPCSGHGELHLYMARNCSYIPRMLLDSI